MYIIFSFNELSGVESSGTSELSKNEIRDLCIDEEDEERMIPSLTVEQQMDMIDENYLLRLQDILINIHKNYFKIYDLWLAKQYNSRGCVDGPSLSIADDLNLRYSWYINVWFFKFYLFV